MTQNKSGLIVNVSSLGGWQYFLNVPYCVGKSACDRMATDCAAELKKENVAMVAIWPNPAKTEYIKEKYSNQRKLIRVFFQKIRFQVLKNVG
jgi:dehydrogenase/reductase SDR family protein 1